MKRNQRTGGGTIELKERGAAGLALAVHAWAARVEPELLEDSEFLVELMNAYCAAQRRRSSQTIIGRPSVVAPHLRIIDGGQPPEARP
jgi:hypothetical protein